jgi:primosomal protein N''
MATFDLGPGILAVLASLITTVGGVVVLWIGMKKDLAKAAIERGTAAEVSRLDRVQKGDQLQSIHEMVNDRLTQAMNDNEEFRAIISAFLAERLAAGNPVTVAESQAMEALRRFTRYPGPVAVPPPHKEGAGNER